MKKAYEPQEAEDRIYKFWERNNFFHSSPNPNKESFVVMMPPPNITGRLHTGHALDFTVQDVFVRFNRMMGKETLWLPGIDHAGIATQAVVERELLAKGIKKNDLGRKKFVEEVWKWKEKYGNTILEQLKKLGVSADWSRLRFTLDEAYRDSVKEAFVKYYNKGLLYRGKRIVNWCPHCHTAISDIEVEYEVAKSKLYYIRYPFKEDPDKGIVVATTRPETMLGDTAVAVHPNDERYKEVIGKILTLPLVGREIPVIGDELIDIKFGTGALKVTPAHSVDDFEIAKRHNLPFISVINTEGKMFNVAKKYIGLTTMQCREAIVKDLKEKGYLVKEEDYENSVGHCQRCHTVVEPLLSEQWFMRMKPLAKKAIKAVENGDIDIKPAKWKKVYYNWLNNIRDWCISRQLWWGHQIPVYYCKDCGKMIASKEPVEKCPQCGSTNIVQDEDVLDTWFSSALWPFATLGWPKETEELKYYYPTTLLVTGYDILFFWVARMIMGGLELTGKKPFKTVLLHGLVRDEKGRKMSKSLKNIIDPVSVIDQYGTDALRFTMAYLDTSGAEGINLSDSTLAVSRNFVNKVWNASRFVIMNIEGFDPFSFDVSNVHLELEDVWFQSRLNKVTKDEIKFLSEYNLGEAARELYDFVWKEFCDWYVELSKVRLYGNNQQRKKEMQFLLWDALNKILRMLHPFIPFVTEEIFSHIPHREKALIIADFPKYDKSKINKQAEKKAEFVFSVVRSIRNLKTAFNIPLTRPVKVSFVASNDTEKSIIMKEKDKIIRTAFLSDIVPADKVHAKTIKSVVSGTTIYLDAAGEIDVKKEKERFKKKTKSLELERGKIMGRLQNESYLKKAPSKVIKKDRDKLKEIEKEYAVTLQHLRDLGG